MPRINQLPADLRKRALARMLELVDKPCYEIADILNAEFGTEGYAGTANSIYQQMRRWGRQARGAIHPASISLVPQGPAESAFQDLFEGYQSIPATSINTDVEGARSIFLSDLHIPFVDWRKLKIVEQFMADWRPDRIFYVGDTEDFYEISRFDKNPNRRFGLQEERRQTIEMLDRHSRIAPAAHRYWLDGNHEERLVRYLWSRSPELADLRDEDTGDLTLGVPSLLGLTKRGIGYQPYSGYVDYLGFLVTHGRLLSKHSSYTAKQMSERFRSSGISGHSHRLGMYNWTGMKGPQAWYECGCLCRLDPDYMPNPNWQQGFYIGIVVNQKVNMLPGIFFDDVLYLEGKVYRGR